MLPFLSFYFASRTKYQVHSPFVFEFVTEVLEDDRMFYFFYKIENFKGKIALSKDNISSDNGVLPIKKLLKQRGIKATTGEILFKTVHLYKPRNIICIGTDLGLSALYQATPNSSVPLVALEENEEIAKKTTQYLNNIGAFNIQIINGKISTNLAKVIDNLPFIDYVFFNQFYGANQTLTYFETCLKEATERTIFVFRAPYQSEESIKCWERLKNNSAVKLSIDLYDLGFLFLRSEQKEVAHFKLIESRKKPWAIY